MYRLEKAQANRFDPGPKLTAPSSAAREPRDPPVYGLLYSAWRASFAIRSRARLARRATKNRLPAGAMWTCSARKSLTKALLSHLNRAPSQTQAMLKIYAMR